MKTPESVATVEMSLAIFVKSRFDIRLKRYQILDGEIMNIISKLRAAIQKTKIGSVCINVEEFNQLQSEWIVRAPISADGQEWFEFPETKPKDQQICLVAAGPNKAAQVVAVRWCNYDEEFYWFDPDLGLDPYPTEATTHWMPFPADPK